MCSKKGSIMSEKYKQQKHQLMPEMFGGTLQPLYDRILVQRLPQEEQTKSGLFIPEKAQDKSWKGRVIALGTWFQKGRHIFKHGKSVYLSPEAFNFENLKVGDVVVFGRYSGADLPDKVKIEGEECIILRQDEVMAIITEI